MPEDRPTVGVLSPLLAGAYYGAILRGLARQLAPRCGRVVAVQTRDAQFGREFPWLPPPFSTPLAWDTVSGFVVVADAITDDYLEQLRERGKPVVLVSAHSPSVCCPTVTADNRGGIHQAVAHLVEHGHRNIAFVGNMDQAAGHDVQERYRAFGEALRRAGIHPDPRLVYSSSSSFEDGGCGAAHAIVDDGLCCTAVVAATDLVASGLLRGFAERGVTVPGRVAVIGFEDRPFASGLSPSLSTLRLDFHELGAEAGRLLARVTSGAPVAPGRYRVKTSLVPRASCGCLALAPRPVQTSIGETGPEQRFGHDVVALLAGQSGTEHEVATATAVATTISRCMRDAQARSEADLPPGGDAGPGNDAGPGAEVSALYCAAEAALRSFPPAGAIQALLACTQRLRRDLLSDAGYSDRRLTALDRCTSELAAALGTVHARQQTRVASSLHRSLAEGQAVSQALVGLGPDEPRPRSLDWLAATHVRAACLGLWDGDEQRRASTHLEVVGTHGPDMAASDVLGARVPAAAFPPVQALTAGGCDPEDIVLVLPVHTDKRYWGLLALAGRTEDVSGADVYLQWASLLGTALDRDSLLQKLRASQERYELAAQAADDGLWDWDVEEGTVFFSRRWKSLLGYTDHEIGTSPTEWFNRAHPDDAGALEDKVKACLTGEQASLHVEHRLLAKDGTYHWVLCRAVAIPAGGRRAVRLVGVLTDIGERKQLESRLRKAALYDPLTGLPNRSLFTDRLSQAFARAKRSPGYEFAVLFIDLDGFKAVNDSWGHATGDALLERVAARLQAHLRDNDTAVRFGGDEFAVLLDGVGSSQRLDTICDRLRAKLSVPYEIDGHTLVISAAIGLAVNTDGYDDPARMVDEADAAMYRAKRALREAMRPGVPLTPAPVAPAPVEPSPVWSARAIPEPVTAAPVG